MKRTRDPKVSTNESAVRAEMALLMGPKNNLRALLNGEFSKSQAREILESEDSATIDDGCLCLPNDSEPAREQLSRSMKMRISTQTIPGTCRKGADSRT